MNNELFPNDPSENENQSLENDMVSGEPSVDEALPSQDAASDEQEVPADADFAEVVPDPEADIPPKKSGGRLIFGLIAASLAVLIAIAALFATGLFGKSNALYRLFHKASDDGVGLIQLSGFATLDGDNLYHIGTDTLLHRTNVKTGETELVSENPVAMISRYQGKLYYLSYALNDATQSYEYSYWKFVDGVNDQKLFSTTTDIAMPQFTDRYIYFMSPVNEIYSGYSNRLFRAPRAGGEVEPVCDLLCLSYLVDGNDLYLSLGEDASFIRVNLEDTVSYVAANPLSEGVLRTSEELSPEILFTDYLVSYAVRYGNSLYYVGISTDMDEQSGYELCSYPLTNDSDKTPHSFNDATYTALFRMYGDFIFYLNRTDSSIYRMRLDGSDVTRITAPIYGYFNTSNDKFLYINWSDNGLPSIVVCDLDGNELTDVPLYDEETRQRVEDSAADSSASQDENYEDFGDPEASETSVDTIVSDDENTPEAASDTINE